jgi:hypothetical protein
MYSELLTLPRMPSSGMLQCVALVRTSVLEEHISIIIRLAGIDKLRSIVFLHSVFLLLITASVVPNSPILVTLMMEAIHSSETSVLTGATRHGIPKGSILHSHHHENLKSYVALTGWAL